jgi:hypothetical protein
MDHSQMIGASLVGLASLYFIFKKTDVIRFLFVDSSSGNGVKPDIDVLIDTDRPAPEGIKEHVNKVIECTPYACDQVRIKYLREGLSEAQILRKEVKRMSDILSLNEGDKDEN